MFTPTFSLTRVHVIHKIQYSIVKKFFFTKLHIGGDGAVFAPRPIDTILTPMLWQSYKEKSQNNNFHFICSQIEHDPWSRSHKQLTYAKLELSDWSILIT